MSKTLFEIQDIMYNLLEYGVSEDGEIIEDEEEFNRLYENIQIDAQTKIDNSNCLCKVIDGEIDVIDKEIDRLKAEKKSRENKKNWIKNNVDKFIRRQFTNEDGVLDTEGLNSYKLSLPHSKVSYRRSNSVEITDQNLIPKKYIKTKIEETPDKTAIKKAIDSGVEVNGAKIITNYNMQIK